ncbi:MAG TPA: cystathionine beta-synthase [Acidimicrobiales bacterium]|nr:cystathionine beta-synthase [Acidimicrobiales bacterium]
MDVLVVVGENEAPEPLVARAGHVLRVAAGDPIQSLVAELRPRIPHDVGVVGSPDVATGLHDAGLPVTLYTDEAGSATTNGVRVLPLHDHGAPMDTAGSLLDLVGHTPLVRLDRIARDVTCTVLAKLEFMNPGGSVKDRPAVAMVDAAERAGLLKEGGTIVEPTSGNTGVGLAIVAARRRYRCIFVMPDKMSQEKIGLLRAYGAEVIVCPTAVAPEHPESYYSVSKRLAEEIPGAFRPNQYANPANPQSHVDSTGPEIWEQTKGRITHFIAGVGTGGTISGVGRYLKSKSDTVQVIGADPEGSVYSGGSGRPYLVEGIGEDFWPETYDPSVVDRIVMVSDRDSFLTARRVTREEGILVGGSAGTAVWAALQVGRELGPEHVVVVLIPDSGRGYLSKLYNDGWMADYGFLRAGGTTAGDVLGAKGGDLPRLVHVHPHETVREVVGILREYGVSQVPVVNAEPPVVLGEVAGAVHERALMEWAFDHPEALDRPVGDVMGPPLPTIGSGESVELAVERLQTSPAILVVDAGHPVGILTRSDLLAHAAGAPAPGAP